MEKKAKEMIAIGSAIIVGGTTIAGAILSNSGNDSRVSIEFKDKKDDKVDAPKVEEKIDRSWITFDENALMYKVNFYLLLKDKYNIKNDTLANADVQNLLKMIEEYLQGEYYAKDRDASTIENLSGKSISLQVSNGRWFRVTFNGEDIKYEVDVTESGLTESKSREILDSNDSFSMKKYFTIYDRKKEFTRSLSFRSLDNTFFSMSLQERIIMQQNYTLTFDSDVSKTKITLSKEEYDNLYLIFTSFENRDDLEAIFVEYSDVLTPYLDSIQAQDEAVYNNIVSLINLMTLGYRTQNAL